MVPTDIGHPVPEQDRCVQDETHKDTLGAVLPGIYW